MALKVISSRPANENIAQPEEPEQRLPLAEEIVALRVDPSAGRNHRNGIVPGSLAQFNALLLALSKEGKFTATIDLASLRTGGVVISTAVRAGTRTAARQLARKTGRLIDAAVSAALPDALISRVKARASNRARHAHRTVLRPRGLVLPLGDNLLPREAMARDISCASQAKADRECLVFSAPFDPVALLELSRTIAAVGRPIVLELSLGALGLDDPVLARISDAVRRVRSNRTADVQLLFNDERLIEASQRLRMLNCECQGVTFEVAVRSSEALSDAELSSLSATLFGRPHDPDQKGCCADLRHIYPPQVGVASFMAIIEAAMDPVRELTDAAKLARLDGILIGRTAAGAGVRMPVVPATHAYVTGRTGTGKSTLVLNMVLADAEEGRGVIVLDPHGDLWADIHARLPASRRGDVERWHVADAGLRPAINMLELGPGDPADERNAVVNDLNRIVRRMIYTADTREAFGPMYDQYFRAGMLLLLEGEGENATIFGFDRIFKDEAYRRELLKRDSVSETTKEEWRTIHGVTYDDHRLNNMTPYITSKLTQLTKSALLRPILDVRRSTLDFDKALAERRIVLINLAAPMIGSEALALVGGIMTNSLTNAAIRQGRLPPEQRTKTAVYLDEFQTYATGQLRVLMAETRKFGIRVTLANQTLSQMNGDGYRASVMHEVLGNAGNLIVFGVDTADAIYLAPRFGGKVSVNDLTCQPNFHAHCLLQTPGGIEGPLLVKTLPARKKR